MKIRFKKEQLMNAVNIASKAVSSKTTMPILECFLISASGDQVSLTANDLELGITTTIEKEKCTVEENGTVAVEARLFSDIVRKICMEGDSDIDMITDGNIIELSSSSSLFKIQAKDPDQFPALQEVGDQTYITLSQYTLKEIIKDTIFSIAVNDSNKLMTGELFEVKGNKLRVISLDGHRISIRTTELRQDYGTISAVIPGKTLNEISKILTGEIESEVVITFSDNYIRFRFDSTTMVSRLIEGEYFRIDSMLSSDYETKLTVNKKDFLEHLERSTILIREVDKKPLIMKIQDSNLNLRMNSIVGSLDSNLMVNKSGKDLMIAFNPKFLLDALRVIEDEEVSLYMTNPKAPCFIKDEEGKYIYLILPVNFNPATY